MITIQMPDDGSLGAQGGQRPLCTWRICLKMAQHGSTTFSEKKPDLKRMRGEVLLKMSDFREVLMSSWACQELPESTNVYPFPNENYHQLGCIQLSDKDLNHHIARYIVVIYDYIWHMISIYVSILYHIHVTYPMISTSNAWFYHGFYAQIGPVPRFRPPATWTGSKQPRSSKTYGGWQREIGITS